jgi:hypothetical protein
MSAQLRRFGYDGEIVRVVEYDSFAEYSLSDETLECRISRTRCGARTLAKIRIMHPNQHLVVCPNDALGDVYWAMAFLPAYREKHGIGEFSVVVTGDGCGQVAELFGTEHIVTLGSAEMDAFVQSILFTREENCVIAHHDRPYTDNIIKYLDKHFLSFTDYYRYAVYGLPRDARPALPTGNTPFENREQMPKGKSVILSPYAKSVVELPCKYWENIAVGYSRQGYAVYTNITGDDSPIRGTAPISAPISQMRAAVEHAGFFIGIRNGLCDIITTARCRKIVIFPDCFYSTTPYKVEDFFALPGWEKIVWRE